ncbi:hypothetical protein VTK26DRAFT_7973 [Humicola hyalothermophila]
MLTSAATTMLRAGAGRTAGGLQPTLLRTAICPYSAGLTIAPFSMACASPSKPTTRTSSKSSPSSLTIVSHRIQTSRRYASSKSSAASRPASGSTDAEADANAADRAAKAQAAAHPEQVVLDWNTFFQLRKARRRWQSAFSVLGALGSGTGGAVLLSTGMADPLMSQIPLDPFISLGLITLSSAALGWLLGPSLGAAVFNMLKSKYKGPMAVKESEFFARIKKHRVDPSASSVRNPVPDFYGEKISSVAGYRQWLRDQRAFNRKKTGATFV